MGEALPDPRPSQPLLNRRVLKGASGAREVRYRREEAAAYADLWWKEGNPEFEIFRGGLHQLCLPMSLCRGSAYQLYW
ncbi:hypothetical protein ACFSQ7_47435 [Paenibacillus rhizoplanae]